MKKIVISILILLFTAPLISRDFRKTEKIIDEIINESNKADGESKEILKKKKNVNNKSDKKSDNKIEQISVTSEDAIFVKIGIELFYSGMYLHSKKKFEEIEKKYSGSPYVDISRIWIGKILIKEYKFRKAIEKFSEIKKDSGEFPRSIYYTGVANIRLGNDIKAIENFLTLSSQFPGHDLADKALLKVAKLYMKKKKAISSMEIIVKLLKSYRSRDSVDDAYFLLGELHESRSMLNDPESARKIYSNFILKAEKGDKYFNKSPLLFRVKKRLRDIDKKYFSFEQ